MMNFKKTLLAASVSLTMVSGVAMADAWTVTQSYTNTDAATGMTQTGTTSAVQSLNSVNLSLTDGTVTDADQTITNNDQALNMLQETTTAGSYQAGNYISAHTITNATQTLTTTDGDLALDQEASGDGNTQALNHASSAAVLTNIQQNMVPSGAGDVNFEQGNSVVAGGDNNVQAGNNVVASPGSTAVSIDQNAGLTDGDYILSQGGVNTGADNDQAVNRIHVDDNSVVLGNGGLVAQDITAATSSFGLTQQSGTGIGSVQAGNLINAGGASATVTQTISVQDATLAQTSTPAVLQAGNALVTGTGSQGSNAGGTMTQGLTVAGATSLTQTSASASHQSGNYMGIEIQ